MISVIFLQETLLKLPVPAVGCLVFGQAQRVEFVRSVGIRTATETMREQRKREDMAVKWRLPGSPVG